jgi:predicted Rossmann fold nucleotide-binding protein DprA/Smf involved in DNA uptake
MSSTSTALSRGDILKKLRSEHEASVQNAQALLKEQKRMQQELCSLMKDEPMTVPELAAAAKLPAPKVLWFVAALKKYGVVVEAGMSGDYPTYQKAKAA